MSAAPRLSGAVRQRLLGYGPGARRSLLAMTVLLSMAVQVLQVSLPLYTMHLFDGLTEGRNLDTVWLLSLIYLLAIVFGVVFRLLRANLLLIAGRHLVRRLFLYMLVAAVQYGREDRPDRAAGLLQDHTEVQRFMTGPAPASLLDLITTPLLLATLFLLHPLYGAFAMAVCAAMALFSWLAERRGGPLLALATEQQARAAQDLARRLGRRDEVQGLGLLRGALRQWRPLFLGGLAAQEAADGRMKVAAAIANLLSSLGQAGIFILGAWLVVGNRAAPGTIIAASMLMGMLLGPWGHVSQHLAQWSLARGAFARLLEALAEDGLRAARPVPPPQPGAGPGLLVRGLTVTVPGRPVPLVEALDLEVPPGSVLIVTGPNGAGKSTLMRTLVGLRPAAAGSALLDGTDLQATPRHLLADRIGFLGQRAQLLTGTVAQNIARFSGRAAEAVAAARLAGAHEMIGRLPQGYGAMLGPASGLSGGQQRLIALARAFFLAPRLVVLDEPEAGLDPMAVDNLRQAVRALRDRGAVVLVVTHGAKGWQQVADQELRLAADGRWACGWLHDAAPSAA